MKHPGKMGDHGKKMIHKMMSMHKIDAKLDKLLEAQNLTWTDADDAALKEKMKQKKEERRKKREGMRENERRNTKHSKRRREERLKNEPEPSEDSVLLSDLEEELDEMISEE